MARFAKSVESLRSSQIRDLMSLAMRPEVISFAGGMPGNELFPLKYIDKILSELTEKEKQVAMQYGPTTGLPQLHESLIEFLKGKNLPVDSHKIIITTGSLQAINILGKAFIDAGDVVITENPAFIGAISAFKSFQADIRVCNIDSDGIIISELKSLLGDLKKEGKKPKFLYITPTFHNPAGITYSLERRKELVKLLEGEDIPVIEDDAYSDLNYDGEKFDSIINLAGDKLEVCYTGSFSKIIGPGLRLGWMLVPQKIYEKCELLKQAMDACSPSFTQVLADKFLRTGVINEYLAEINEEYKKRRDAMCEELEKHLPSEVKWTKPKGGFYIWLILPKSAVSTDILKLAIDKGVVFVSGSTFNPNEEEDNAIRISFCNTDVDAIRKGIPIVAESIKSYLDK